MTSNQYSNSIDLCNNWDTDKMSNNNPRTSSNFRFLIITLGPTGAGKSTMATNLKKVAQKINSSAYRYEWFNKVLDDYIEESDLYKSEMAEFIEKNKGGINISELDGCSIYEPKWTQFAKEMSRIYFKARIQGGLADKYNADFNESIKNGKNMLFEITGKNKLSVIKALNTVLNQTGNCKTYKYIILAGYSIVDYYLLQARNISRFQNDYIQFINDPSKKPPRLPWIGCFNNEIPRNESSILSYCQVLNDIKNTVIELINCGYVYSSEKNKLRNNAGNANKSTTANGGQDVFRIIEDGKCYLDKTANIEAGRKSIYIPKGLYIDYLYIYNNIYLKVELLAKINLSERSRILENPDHFNEKGRATSYYEQNSIPVLIDVINRAGPPANSQDRVYDICGLGTPLPTNKTDITSHKYIQEYLNKDGGAYIRNTRRKKNKITMCNKRRTASFKK